MPAMTTADRRSLPTVAKTFFGILEGLDTGQLRFTDPSGQVTEIRGARPGVSATLHLRDWQAVTNMLRTAEIGLAEAYRDGLVETEDLTALLLFWLGNADALARYFYAHPLAAAWLRLKHWWRSNSRGQARRNIQAHYDLSNDFYATWLDETMTYSSGLGVHEGSAGVAQLAEAQRAKYARILDKLAAAPGAHILEVGCGWGGFAEQAARQGMRVTGITLSPAQLAFAKARMERAGLSGLVDLQLIDYRDIRGSFDHIVSIEMFEAVGERYWQTYFRALKDRLKTGGKALVQAITIDEAAFPAYRRGSDFIREYIFPGGMLAPLSRMERDAGQAGLRLREAFGFGADYARTLAAWLARVNATETEIRALGFGVPFLQLWRFYLCYCEAGFRAGRTDVYQLLFEAP
ncbi:MAG: class I SAM-dependent methyltransferase [Gammaproteobacteria bacterium]|nr:class I SAM-dependent methyltransferase [Gammaproteobacteria bacterium]